MALTPQVFYSAQPAATSTTLLTVADTAGKYAIVKNITICNTTASSATIHFANCPAAAAEADANRFIKNMSVPGHGSIFIDMSLVVGQNYVLRATASAAATLTVFVSGVGN